MLYKPYSPQYANAVIEAWNDAIGAEFPMDARLWQQKIDSSERTFIPASWIAFDGDLVAGFAIGRLPGNLTCLAVRPAYRRRGIGRALLERFVGGIISPSAKALAGRLTATGLPPEKLVTGQDYHHFFPGVPEIYEGTLQFFEACGWTRSQGWAVDLCRDLTGYRIAPEVADTIQRLAADGIVLRACTPDDVASLLKHIETEFSRGWLDVTSARVRLEADPLDIKIAVRGQDVIGFAQTFTKHSAVIGPSVSWRRLLGPDYGGLGPIGIAKEVRKIGLGLAILSYSVEEVRKSGATRMAIDWTVLVDFYGRVGFNVWKRYIPCTLEL
ncbi:MAG: GNAT family N-acetyltransferase [Capsulimonadaceae bacterium]|nr:GNAT family N-acetyltransferase [Capsulimonadaceae bacterium]